MVNKNIDIELLKQSYQTMEKRFDKIEKILSELPEKLEERFDKKFANKIEVAVIKEKTTRHDWFFATLGTVTIGTLGTALYKLIMM